MKKTVIYCVIIFLVGIFLGRFSVSPSPTTVNITLTGEQKKLSKWENIKKSPGIAEKIYERALAILRHIDQNSYSNGDLRIKCWGEAFGDGGIEIYYKNKLVFDASSGLFSDVGQVRTFRPGEWINQLQTIDVEKERSIQKTESLKRAFKPI